MDVSEAKRLKALEDENAKLKKLLAEQMRDAAALQELLSVESVDLNQKRFGDCPVSFGTLDWLGHGIKAKHINQDSRTMSRNILYLVVGALAVVAVILGYQVYQARQKTTGVEISIGERGVSIEKK